MVIEHRTEGKVEFLHNANHDKKPPLKDERNVELVSNILFRLMNQAELRVPVAKILDLLWCAIEAVVALAQVTLPVLPLAVHDTEDRENQHTDLTDKIDGMARRVLGRIIRYVCPSSQDTTRSS
jgi:hypothetical protein